MSNLFNNNNKEDYAEINYDLSQKLPSAKDDDIINSKVYIFTLQEYGISEEYRNFLNAIQDHIEGELIKRSLSAFDKPEKIFNSISKPEDKQNFINQQKSENPLVKIIDKKITRRKLKIIGIIILSVLFLLLSIFYYYQEDKVFSALYIILFFISFFFILKQFKTENKNTNSNFNPPPSPTCEGQECV